MDPSQQFDQQQHLLALQLNKIKQSSHCSNPFLINCFNEQFDKLLKQLVVYYQFDFDKICLHLYYQFPQYQQKIKNRTVGLRWWQIQMGRRMGQNGNQIEKINNINDKNKQYKYSNYEQYFKNSSNLFNFPSSSSYNNNNSSQSQSQAYYKQKLYQFNQAISMAQILTEQQSQRFIIYKPKFIMDTQYRLEQYNNDNNNNNQQNQQNSKSFLESLKKVLSNQIRSEFEVGGFDRIIKANKGNKMDDKNRNQDYWMSEEEDDEDEQNQLQQNQINQQQKNNLFIEQQQNYLQQDWQAYQSD